jgi:hypothetical protein
MAPIQLDGAALADAAACFQHGIGAVLQGMSRYLRFALGHHVQRIQWNCEG